MKGFQAFRKFKTKFEYDAGFNKLPKWDDIKAKKAPKVKMEEPITFEYISQEGAKSVTDALDQNRKVSVKTPLSVRWTEDGKLNEDMQLPYSLSTKEDDILKPVDIKSTCIDSWDYDPSTLDLDVYFVSNPSNPPKAYTFPGVPKSVVKRWILSPSKGQFYWRVIRRYSIA